MRKRIVLFIIGFVVAAAVFLLYQVITGASFLSPKKSAPLAVSTTQEDRPPTYEQRSPNGNLLYLLSAKKAAPLKDEAGNPVLGQYTLVEPVASYYTSDGNLLFIRADRGAITVNDRGGGPKEKTGIKDVFRGAHLSGNVMLTYGPRDSFTDNSPVLKPGQAQARFEHDLDLNYAEGIVTSPGLFHVRTYDGSAFDGDNLTVAFSRTPNNQKIELLRIEPTSGQTNYMLIKNAGHQGQGFSLEDSVVATRPAGTRAARVAATTPKAVGATPVPTTARAKAPKTPPTTYKLSFGKEVTASLGDQKLMSDQLFILKMPGSEGNSKTTKTSDTTVPAIAPAVVTASAPAPVAPVKGVDTGPGKDDLVVTWTGPMEMRPATAEDTPLAGPSDLVLEAVGTPERPVQIQDELHTARAGLLRYHKLNTAIELEPGNVGPVVITDAVAADRERTTLTINGLSFSRDDNRAHLVGPGTIAIPQSVVRRATTMPAGVAAQAPLLIRFEKAIDITLSPVADVKNPNHVKNSFTIRRAIFTGGASIQDVNFSVESDALDVLVANDGNGGQGVEHLLALGHVHVRGENHEGAGITDAAKPNGLNSDRLELMTALLATTKLPVPSELLADGNVTAWAYDQPADKTREPSKRTVYTPKLEAVLAAKAGSKSSTKPAATGANPESGLGNVDVKMLTASDGVIVELEGFNLQTPPQTIYAKGRTLTVNREGGTDAATAVLDGERLADGTIRFAELSEGERGDYKITGLQILLDEKTRSIDIPGKGTFDFVQPGQKASDPSLPVEVTWTQSMHFDNKTNVARFLGDIDAHLVGKTDQVSTLTAHKMLEVVLTGGKDGMTTAPATTAPAVPKMHLSEIHAQGDVKVLAETLDPSGKLLTRLFLQKVDALTYIEATKTLNIPGSGALLLQDYRPEKIDPAAPDKTDDSNGHGDTAFTWDGSLVYNGPTGAITFSKNVYMKHQPIKPFKVLGTEPGAKPAGPVAPAANDPMVLTTQTLVATLLQSKASGGGETIASPVAMGVGGAQKIKSVDASGGSVLKMGQDQLSANVLHFDAVTHIATADGTEENPAEIIRPGETLTHADHISWDLTKGKNAIEATGIHGTFQQN